MIFPIPRLIEHISSIMALEGRFQPFSRMTITISLGITHTFMIPFSHSSCCSTWGTIVFFFSLIEIYILVLLFSLCWYKPNQEWDLIHTGTPSGVGPVVPGDQVECLLNNAKGEELIKLKFSAVQREGGYRFQPEAWTLTTYVIGFPWDLENIL